MTDLTFSSPTPLQEAVFLASLADGHSRLTTAHIDTSTYRLVENLLALGVAIVVDETTGSIDVAGAAGYWPNSDAELVCRNDLPVACMLLAAGSIGHGQYTVICDLPEDDGLDLTAMVNSLRDLGAGVGFERHGRINAVTLGPTPIRGGGTHLPETCSPSVIASVLMIAPYAITDVFLRTAAPDLTTKPMGVALSLIDQFGASIVVDGPHVVVPAPQRYGGRELAF